VEKRCASLQDSCGPVRKTSMSQALRMNMSTGITVRWHFCKHDSQDIESKQFRFLARFMLHKSAYGQGKRMTTYTRRHLRRFVASLLLLMLANTASAVNITYQVRRSVSNDWGCGLATGTITTDGTLGLISSENFVSTAVTVYDCSDGDYVFRAAGSLEAVNLWADQYLLYMFWVPGSPPTVDDYARAYIVMGEYQVNDPECTLDCNPWAIVSYVKLYDDPAFTFDGVTESIAGALRDVTAPIVTIGVAVPEPTAATLLSLGLVGLRFARRRRVA
jgi:hypothetical protein